jgi:hypothetical protein
VTTLDEEPRSAAAMSYQEVDPRPSRFGSRVEKGEPERGFTAVAI